MNFNLNFNKLGFGLKVIPRLAHASPLCSHLDNQLCKALRVPGSALYITGGNMKTSQSLQRCAHCVLSQPARYLLTSSNRGISTVYRRSQAILPSTGAAPKRQFSSSPSSHESKPPSKTSRAVSFTDLIRETRRAPQKESITDRWAQLQGSRNQNAATGASQGIDQNYMVDKFADDLHQGPSISLRLRPTLGRTVEGLAGEPMRGFRILERKCSENNVKRDFNSQLFHVRRGQRRKNLKSERWRRLFKQGFAAELNRVRRMRKQGW